MARLILYKNKQCNTTYLTACIIKFCEFQPEQAEQCATIVNSKGEYAIKQGEYEEIEEISYLFENVGVVTKITE